MSIREVTSRDGVTIVYRVTGPPEARSLVLLHGWSADLTCWGAAAIELAQRYRVVAVDLRGHGYSDAPDAGYDDAANWAADIAAVLTAEQLTDVVLLGWSYGGLVLTDYIAEYGTGSVAAVVYVGAINGIGPDVDGGRIGPAMRAAIPGVFEESPGRALKAFAHFGDANTGPGPDKGADAQRMLGSALSTSPRVRKALFVRTRDHDATLRALDVPALVVHGTDDPIVDVAVARYAVATIPNATAAEWDGAEHAPFVEDRPRFVAELSKFIDELA